MSTKFEKNLPPSFDIVKVKTKKEISPNFCSFSGNLNFIHSWKKIDSWSNIRVSIQGVKSLWGDRVVFSRLGTGDTDLFIVSNIQKIYFNDIYINI